MDDDPLLGFGLRSVQLTDQAALNSYFQSLSEPLSDYTFSQLYTWRNSLRILWREIQGHLCVFANGSGDLTLLMPPIGDGNGDRAMREAFEMMDAYNAAKGVPDRSRIEYASEELLKRFDCSKLAVRPLGTDYLYDVRRMIDLAGGDLSSKRQAKNRFMRNYAYRVEPYSAAKHLGDCHELLQLWKQHQDAQRLTDPSINAIKRQKETLACELTLQCAPELGLKGMVVYVKEQGDRAEGPGASEDTHPSPLPHPYPLTPNPSPDGYCLRGFTFGETLGRDQSSIVIEKTDLAVKGLAQFIFSEFCQMYWSDRPLVNVGDDWGLETLAWTKMSYRPVKLLQKHVLRKPAAVQVAIPAPQTGAAAAQPAPAQVRSARKTDVTAAVEIEQKCFSAYCLTKRQLNYLQQRPSAVFVVAEHEGQIIGEGVCLVRQHKRGRSGRIYSLAVDTAHRGQKIGQRLLTKMLDELGQRGVQRVYLEVEQANTNAIHLYERHGFRPIEVLPDYYGAGKDGLHMRCQMPAAPGLFAAESKL